jgi:hypothetical protein
VHGAISNYYRLWFGIPVNVFYHVILNRARIASVSVFQMPGTSGSARHLDVPRIAQVVESCYNLGEAK